MEGHPTKSDASGISEIIDKIASTLTRKGSLYTESVISVLPRNDWLSQIVIKANRAQRALDDDKLKDELLDTACYCILLLDKINRETPIQKAHRSIDECIDGDNVSKRLS